MAEVVQRMIDDGGPFALWAPAPDLDAPPCGHGAYIEMPLEQIAGASEDEITLLLRAAERLGDCSVRTELDCVKASLSLSTRRWVPHDERAARFLDEHAWLGRAVDDDRVQWLRERQRRAIAQRDRSLSARALDRFEPGSMVAYDRLFPADWDLVLVHDGRSYWAVDQHCLNPTCSCAAIVAIFYPTSGAGHGSVGDARLELRGRRQDPKASSPLVKRIFDRLWQRHAAELTRRHDEVRRAVLRSAAPAIPAVVQMPRRTVARNDACPCGSGRKYKRCCGDPSAAAER